MTKLERDGPVLLTISATCLRYSTSRSRLYELISIGRIVARKAGARTLVERRSADEYFLSLPRVRRG